MKSGYVYVLINPAMEGLVKVGKTSRSSAERATELSSPTGVPAPFVTAYDEYFSDADAAEQYVHTLLEHKGYRLSTNREFFEAPLKEIILSVQEAKRNLMDREFESQAGGKKLNERKNEDLVNDIVTLARKYEHGLDDFLEDKDKALELYKRALKLGNAEAYWCAGVIYLKEKHDEVRALELFKVGAERTRNRIFRAYCYQDMAAIYGNQGHTRNALKCLERLFSLVEPYDVEPISEHVGREGVYVYIESVFEYIEMARREDAPLRNRQVLITRLYTELEEAEKERQNSLPTEGILIITRTAVHDLLYYSYIQALEDDDYSQIDKDFPDEAWGEVLNGGFLEIDGKLRRI